MRRDIGICVCLAVATVAVYWPVGGYGFTNFDDPGYVSENPHVLAGLTWEGVRWAFTNAQEANWHPLTWLSHMLDCQLFGPSAGRHHLVNVGLHALSILLLFLVLARMTGRRWPSAMVAALFALHPLHVESVAWISERKDVLSALFWMLTMGAYVLYAERPSVIRYLPVFVFLALGLMAKPMLVTLPFVLLLLDFWPLGRLPQTAAWKAAALRLVAEKIPLLLLVAASSVVTYVVQQKGGAVMSTDLCPFDQRVPNAPVAYVAYLAKTVWPAGLAVFYPYDFHLPAWQAAFSAVGLVVVMLLALALLRRRPYVAVGWFWYLGTLVPVIGLVQAGNQAMADRYTYVPLVGIFVAAVWFVADWTAWWRHRMKALVPAAAAALIGFAAVTFNQVGYWSDSETLFRHALAVTVDNEVAHGNLGNALAEKGETDEAIREFREVLRVNPNSEMAHNNLGNALAKRGQMDEAIREFRTALNLKPEFAYAHNNLGLALAVRGQQDEAIREFRTALNLQPGYAAAHKNLGLALAARGQTGEAIRHYQEALRLQPDDVEVLNNLAWILATAAEARLRVGAEAVRLAERACELNDRKNPTLLDTLAAAYAAAGRFDEAVRTAEEARRLALAAGAKMLADAIGARLELYRSGRSYGEPTTKHQEAQ